MDHPFLKQKQVKNCNYHKGSPENKVGLLFEIFINPD